MVKLAKMTVEPKQVTIEELFDGFKDMGENGVIGYHGQLNIRPKFQREFIYDEDKQKAVINTVLKGFPLNTMYWAISRNDKTGERIKDSKGRQVYELLDGQQRTISICHFLQNKFSIDEMTAKNIEDTMPDKYKEIMNYPLQVYVCDGPTSDKLSWFRTINIAGVALTEQELLNAQYTGAWLTDAKSYFSRPNKKAIAIPVIMGHTTKDYFKFKKGEGVNRQTLLQRAIIWKTEADKLPKRTLKGDNYMSAHQTDKDAEELKSYFQAVFDWVGSKFTKYRKAEKSLPWGHWYNMYQNGEFKGQLIEKDSRTIEKELTKLDNDDDIKPSAGEYRYILTGDPKVLNFRAFDVNDIKQAWINQKGKCPMCEQKIGGHTYPDNQSSERFGKNSYNLKEMEADHIVPWSKGGKTIPSNLQMLCKWHNKFKSND